LIVLQVCFTLPSLFLTGFLSLPIVSLQTCLVFAAPSAAKTGAINANDINNTNIFFILFSFYSSGSAAGAGPNLPLPAAVGADFVAIGVAPQLGAGVKLVLGAGVPNPPDCG